MTETPYPISGVVYDTDNSTVVELATVLAYNQTNNESLSVTTNSSGEYSLDLANYDTDWTAGDVIFISAFIGQKSVDYRTTVSGTYEEKDLYLMNGASHAYFDAELLSGLISNTADAVGNVKFYDRTNDLEIMDVRVLATTSVPFNFAVPIKVQGLCRVPSANTMKATIQADL